MPALSSKRDKGVLRYTANNILALIAKGSNGAWYNSRNLYQTTAGVTAATANGDSVGIAFDISDWGGLTLDQIAATQPELVTNGDFASNITGWTVGASVTAAWSAGEAQITGAGNPNNNSIRWFSQDDNLTRYAGYLVSFDATYISTAGTFYGQFGFSTNQAITSVANGGVKTNYSFRAPADSAGGGTPWESIVFGADASSVWKLDNVSVKLIPGNLATQATAGSRPTLQFSGGRPLLRGNGTARNLLIRLLAPTTSGVIGGPVTVPASISALQVLIGGTVGTSRCFIGINTSGQLCAGLGTDAETVIVGTDDLRGRSLCIWLTWDGTTVKLYQDGTQVYSAGQNGAPGADAFRLFATNNGGTAANFGAMDAYHFMIIDGYVPSAYELSMASIYFNLN